jgi:hypothetical protein
MSLQDATSACHELLTSCCGLVALRESGWAQCRLAELNLWSDSVGVFAKNKNALAHRLRLYPQVTEVILSLLNALSAALEKCHKSDVQTHFRPASSSTRSYPARGQTPDEGEVVADFGNPDSDGDTDRVPPRSFSPWSDQDDVEDTSVDFPPNEAHASPSLLGENCRIVELMLGQILDIGQLIRRSGYVSRLSRADASFTDGSEHHLRRHLQIFLQRQNMMSEGFLSRYGHELSSQDIVQIFGCGHSQTDCNTLVSPHCQIRTEQWQLIKANLIRRHRFVFFRKRAARLRKPRTLYTSDKPVTKSLDDNGASTTITKRQPEIFTNEPIPKTRSHEVQTSVPATSSLASVGQISASTADPALLLLNIQEDQSVSKVETLGCAPSTQFTQTGTKLSYPEPPPKISLQRTAFSCPCCHEPFAYSKAQSKTSWR